MDTLDKERRSRNMRRIRSKDTMPELIVRRLVYKMGYRYHLHRNDLPGKPDLVFTKKRKVIFVHGCFWHHHPDLTCNISHMPKSNTTYWNTKLGRNLDRDKRNVFLLQKEGWSVLIIWECQLKELGWVSDTISRFLG